MEHKYTPPSKAGFRKPYKTDHNRWKCGPDLYQREIFYAWHKHRSQCRFRQEPYELTFEDWQSIWADPEEFAQRGRQRLSIILTRIDYEKSWTMANVEKITRLEQLRRSNKRIHTGMKYDWKHRRVTNE
jgi:hypothetical protein